MKLHRGRRAAMTAALAAALSFGVGAYALRGRVLEWWWIRQLDSKDEAAVRHAATRLVEAKAVRAIPRMVARLVMEHRKAVPPYVKWDPGEEIGDDGAQKKVAIEVHYLLERCLIDFGPAGVAAWLGSPAFGVPLLFLEEGDAFTRHPTLPTSFLACVSHTDPTIRLRALESLESASPLLEPTFRAQLAALRDPERDIRNHALLSLCENGFTLEVQWAALPDLVRGSALSERVRLLARVKRFSGHEEAKLELIEQEIQRGDWTAVGHYGTPMDVALRVWPRGRVFPVVVRLLRHTDPRAQAAAARALLFGQESMAKNPKDLDECADALHRLIERRTDRLTEPLQLLGILCPDEPRTLPTLLRFLEDSAPSMREAACNGLAALGPSAASAVPALIRRLDDFANSLHVCTAAATALGAIGPKAEAAAPRLLQHLKNKDADNHRRCVAVEALPRVAPKSLEAFLSARDVFLDPREERDVRESIALRMNAFQVPTAEIVGVLVQALSDSEVEIRPCARRALRGLGLRAKAARDALVKITSVESYTAIEWDAVETLWAVTGDVDFVLDLIRTRFQTALSQTDWSAVGLISNVLAEMGPRAISAAPLLEEALGSQVFGFEAWRALSKVEPNNPHLVATLTEKLRSSDDLHELLDADRVDRPLLVRLLSRCLANPELRVRLRAANLLKDLGRDASAAAPELEKLLADPEEAVRLEARAALGRNS